MIERKIVDYYINCRGINIPNTDPRSIEKTTKKCLKNGWLLYGFPFAVGDFMYQAMVKYEDEK